MVRRTRWIGTLALAAAILFGPGLYYYVRLSLLQWRLDRQLTALSAEHSRLAAEQARLQSDATYVEGLIRSTFKWARPGEYVVPLDSSREPAR